MEYNPAIMTQQLPASHHNNTVIIQRKWQLDRTVCKEHLIFFNEKLCDISLMVQWLRFQASTAGSTGLVPSQGTKIPQPQGKMKERKEGRKHKVIKGQALLTIDV